ncbi:hemolysin family protein [Corynebacterium sp. 11A]|uniref:hemolysin family protein n=1 Tax=Corynebacterium sp. 11A TaxID=2080510 RepID=UPI00124D608B|nr:hemolysin family protein [Corynebacterium sp. 11A]
MEPTLLLIFVLGAVVATIASAAFGTIESAVSSISPARVEEMVKSEKEGSKTLLKVLQRRADNINLLVLLRTLLDAIAAVLIALFTVDLIDGKAWALLIAVLGFSLINYLVVGVFSRTVGRKNPYTVSLRSAVALSAIGYVLGPISRILIWVGNKLTPGDGFRDGPFASEVEVREMVDMALENGIVENSERKMIQSVFDLTSTTARQVMVPRPEMVWIEQDKNAGQATSLCVRSGYSRIPVIGENVDDIVGVVYLKDLVQQTYYSTDGGRSVAVTDVMREPSFVPDSKSLDELLQEMQLQRFHIAMLVDEYGGIAGLISIEDILEEIVGEIADEYDSDEIAPIEKISERCYRVHAKLSLDELEEFVAEELEQDLEFDDDLDVDTVGGLMAFGLGRVPLPGSSTHTHGLTLAAEGGTDRKGRMRIVTVVVSVDKPAEQDEEPQR